MTRTVGIVVPAFRPNVDVLHSYVLALASELEPAAIRIELDDPAPTVRARLADLPAAVNAVTDRRGKGAAITAGFEALETDVYAFADADGSTPAPSVKRVIDPVLSGETMLATGSRRHPDADVRSHQSILRRGLGDGFAWLARRLLTISLHDYQCGIKAIDADAWTTVRGHLREPGFGWDIEFLALADALGYQCREIPVTWEDDPDTTVSPASTAVELASALVYARYRAKDVSGKRVLPGIKARASNQMPLLEQLSRERPNE